MNSEQYMIELQYRLGRLPLSPEDVSDAVQFYKEYFAEAGPEREQAVMTELGSPAFVAAQIALKLSNGENRLDNMLDAPDKKTVRKHMSLFRTIMIGIVAAPIAMPLAVAVAAVVFSLLVAAIAVFFALGVSGITCMGMGALMIGIGIPSLATQWASLLTIVGGGLISFGIGGLLLRFSFWISKIFFRALARFCGFVFNKIKKGGVQNDREKTSIQ